MPTVSLYSYRIAPADHPALMELDLPALSLPPLVKSPANTMTFLYGGGAHSLASFSSSLYRSESGQQRVYSFWSKYDYESEFRVSDRISLADLPRAKVVSLEHIAGDVKQWLAEWGERTKHEVTTRGGRGGIKVKVAKPVIIEKLLAEPEWQHVEALIYSWNWPDLGMVDLISIRTSALGNITEARGLEYSPTVILPGAKASGKRPEK